MTNQVFSDWGKEIIPNSQLEKSMAEVAVVNALLVRKGYLDFTRYVPIMENCTRNIVVIAREIVPLYKIALKDCCTEILTPDNPTQSPKMKIKTTDC